MRTVSKVAAVFATAVASLVALSALGKPVAWGIPADAGLTALLDGGVQVSMCLQNTASVGALYCTVQDAGAANVASVGVSLLGSTDCVHYAQIGNGVVFVGGPSTLAIDPVTSGATYWAVQIDAGASNPAAGYISCSAVHRTAVP